MSMKIELTKREVQRIVPILRTQYHKSCNLLEIAEIKGILQKLGEIVEDWTPSCQELEKQKSKK
ncbi:hypothetical protein DW952_14340 [Ruminococcus sp. AM44-9AT]|jgi:hypothetical protein|nr:hypothetical protein DW952_14340 [Ruminococcus sp. AM44-9AT]